MVKIKFDEENHTALKSDLDAMKTKLDDVVTKITELQTEFSSNFEGEAATALTTALNQLKFETDSCVTNWSDVLSSADSIATSLKAADNAAKSTIENGAS